MLGLFQTSRGWEVQNVDRETVAGPFGTEGEGSAALRAVTLGQPAPEPGRHPSPAGMTRASAYDVIGRLREFTREDYAGRLLHIGDDRYWVGHRDLFFLSPAGFMYWQNACTAAGTFGPSLSHDQIRALEDVKLDGRYS